METALIVMAAGYGMRYGGGIKQFEPIGPCGECIMDYSVHDAIVAGFQTIIFVLRRDIEEEFHARYGAQIAEVCRQSGVTVRYAFQAIDALPPGYPVPAGRKRLWGTVQAVLACKAWVQGPFAVINADDFYGLDALRRVHENLLADPAGYCMVGYPLYNTLSDTGPVTRGICKVDASGMLAGITEMRGVEKAGQGVVAQGIALDPRACASMNLFGMPQAAMALLERGFLRFLDEAPGLEREYILPEALNAFLAEGKIRVRVLRTEGQWIGMTYRADRDAVQAFFAQNVARGAYTAPVFADLIRQEEQYGIHTGK